MLDYIIVGAGLTGITLAERLASIGKHVTVIDKRSHVGGNCFDYINKDGILVQRYGPHIFNTNDKRVWDYFSRFTDMVYYQNKVLGLIDGKFVPIPFNFVSLHTLFPISTANSIENKTKKIFGENKRISFEELYKVEDKELTMLADYIFEKVFKHYTEKQWGTPPEKVDKKVLERVPCFVTSYENKYFDVKYQGLPAHGYQIAFFNMLSSSKIDVVLEVNANDVLRLDIEERKIYFDNTEFHGILIYTGMLDELFKYKLGRLPYRAIDFKFETLNKEYFQSSAVISHPNDHKFTRITEFKHFYNTVSPKTTILKEYPKDYSAPTDIPCYPVSNQQSLSLYNKYKELASNFDNLIVVGRLGSFEYLNMDKAISKALDIFEGRLKDEQ